MTYSAGGLIQATDYNGFVSTNVGANVNTTWGTAASGAGYGQTPLGTVSAAGIVTATQWASLVNTMTSMGNHQGTAITSRTAPSAGQTISVLSNVNTDLTNLYTNRKNCASNGAQYTAWTGTASKTAATGSGTNAWTIVFTHTMTFANAASCFAFWNAGGYAKIQFNKSSTGAPGDTDWNAFITSVCASAVYFTSDSGTKTVGALSSVAGTSKTGGTGTPSTLASGIGFNQLTTSNQTIYQQFDTLYPYTGNYVLVQALVNNVATPTAVTFTTTWNSVARTAFQGNGDISGGTATTGVTFGTAPATVVTYFPPESTYLTNSWGTPTVAATTV